MVEVERVLSPTPLPARSRRALLFKYALDRLIAVGALLVTAPLIVGVAVALRLRGGPVLRRRQQLGEGGRRFVLPTFAVPEDRLLARLGVPALPQLWSVLTGQMSIVGPRPRGPGAEPPPARPGLTGLAQLEQLERWLSVPEQLALDDRYAREWSLGLDARIMWRTLTSSGAGPARPRR